MSGGYAQLRAKAMGSDQTQKIKVKRSRLIQALKAKRRALQKLGNKAENFLTKWESLKAGEDKEKADGFIASLLATGYSHIEVQSLLKIGGSRVARLSKPDWAAKCTIRKPPSHAASDDDITAIREQINNWVIVSSYGCSHLDQIEYFVCDHHEDSKPVTWKTLYSQYVQLRTASENRVLSYNRWLNYVRYFRPNLKLTKASALNSCSRCFPTDDVKLRKSDVLKQKIKVTCVPYQLIPIDDDDNESTHVVPPLTKFTNKQMNMIDNRGTAKKKCPYTSIDTSFPLDTHLSSTSLAGNTICGTPLTGTANWNTIIGLNNTNHQQQPIDNLALLNNQPVPNQCESYIPPIPPHAPVPSTPFHTTPLPAATEFFSADNGYFAQNSCEFFPLGVGKIPFAPNASPDQTMCFKHYNDKEVVLGRSMKDWLRFSVCFWHSFHGCGRDPFGDTTITRHWDNGPNPMETAKQRLRAGFEFFTKLGVPFWTFHDRDIAPEGQTLAETNHNHDELSDLALELQNQTGVRLLWNTCNLFSHPRYMNGAATSNDAHVFAYAAAQVKKGLDTAKKLGALNFVFWGGREGFQSLLNTDVMSELDHMAKFFSMVVEYKEKINFTGQLLIEPKPKEPLKHQYDYDAMTVLGFLERTGLKRHFKINVEPNHTMLAGHDYIHDIKMASTFGMLGSIDANTGSPDLGWDTDQFPTDLRNSTLMLKVVLEQGGLQPGGLNFDCKLRRESTDFYDLFIAHIGAMDTLARGLKAAAKIIEDGIIDHSLKNRYVSFSCGIGKKIQDGTTSLEELEKYILEHGEPSQQSAKQEHFEAMLNHYL